MQRFKKILLALGPEPKELGALVRAIALARRNRASLHVLVVLEHLPLDDLPLGTRTLIGVLDQDALRGMIARRQQAWLQNELSALCTEDLDVSTSVEWSHTPFLTIAHRVLRHGHDLLIKTAERVTGPKAALFHPTDRHLMRKCPCPVWMIRPERHATYRRILAAVDPFPNNVVNDELNRQILELASSLAAGEEAELHLVHAYHISGKMLLPSDVAIDAYEKAIAALRQERLESLLAGYSLLPHNIYFEEGVPGEVIPAVARRERIDLIVIGTLARIGIPGLFIGNTAERTLDHVECDVLAVKPKGFVTPIQLPEQD